MLEKTETKLASIIDAMGYVVGVLLILMILNVAYDVFMRYALSNSSIGMQEMEWHLFATIILLGMGYALKDDAHVRVDFLYDRATPKRKALINIIGTLLFLIPFTLLIIYGSYDFVADSYEYSEISEDPGGLHYRWIIKGMIPFGFLFLLLSAIYFLIKNIRIYKGER